MPTEPKHQLSGFLTTSDGKDGAAIDTKTDFPTADIVKAQMYHRLMYRMGVTPAKDYADDFAKIMFSFDRRSRKEAVIGLTGRIEEKPQTEELGGEGRGGQG